MSFRLRLAALALAFVSAVQAGTLGSLVQIKAAKGPVVPNAYIVTLKPSAQLSTHRDILRTFQRAESDVKYEWASLHAFAGTFSDDALLALRQSDDVAAIEPDTVGGVDALMTQTDAIWNLQRISQVAKLASNSTTARNYMYTYDDSAGAGVDIYVVDSGVNVNHTEFEGRASWGTSFGGYPVGDGFGHGTHVAGTAAGKTFGVAKKANIIAVRILSNNGSGQMSDCVAAIDWATQQATTLTFRPSVITISLHFPPSDVLDAAVTNAVNAGVHLTASAGNGASSWDTQSPGRAAAAITVGATDINDEMSYYSNFGAGVDIFAPGDSILSSYIGSSNNETVVMSGTSMSTPHVAGLVAYLVGLEGNKPTSEILARLKEFSPDGILTGVPSDTNNELADNGATL
ncbi:subtilisin-like protein [Daedaleopsis nitida]|nr:subtilisin-like protein [Daedaleopsis nitida]